MLYSKHKMVKTEVKEVHTILVTLILNFAISWSFYRLIKLME